MKKISLCQIRFMCTALCCALLLWSGTPVKAAEEQTHLAAAPGLTELSIEELMNIKVTTVSKKPERYFETLAAIYVITADEIRRSGVTSIPEAIRLAPGTEVTRIDSSRWAVSIRGDARRLARSLLVLIDGRPVYSPLFGGVYWETSDVMLEDVDRIEVIRGPGSTYWGANAQNGVINIITKKANETQGTLVSAGGGTTEKGFGSVRYGAETGSGMNYRLYAKYFNRDGLYHDDDNRKDYDDWQKAQLGFRLDKNISDKDILTVQGDLFDADLGVYETITSPTAPYAPIAEEDMDSFGGNILARWHHDVSPSSDWEFKFFYDYLARQSSYFDSDVDMVDFDFQHRFQLTLRQEILWGIGYRLVSYDTKGSFTLGFEPEDDTNDLFTGFVQDEIALVEDKLILRLGSKFEHNEFSGTEAQPSARISWKPTEHHLLWVSVTRALRTPTPYDHEYWVKQYGGVGAWNHDGDPATPPIIIPAFAKQIGNEDVETVDLIAHEIGYRVQPMRRLSVDVTAFSNEYSNLLTVERGATFVETTEGPPHYIVPFYIENNLDAKYIGAEMSVDFDVFDWWRLHAAQSWLHMDNKAHSGSDYDNDTTRIRLNQASPKHKTDFHSYMDLPGNVELDLVFRSVSRIRSKNVSGYNTLDARIAWEVKPKLEISVVGQSLLDDHHPEESTTSVLVPYTEVPRSVYGKVQWQF